MDSGKETDIEAEVTQPVDDVVSDTEESEATPQAEATEQTEVFIEEDDGDQEKPTSSMTQEQAHAAFRKEQAKRKRKNEELEKEKAERERLQREVEELKATVGDIARGEMPDPYDYDDKHEYYKALKLWEGKGGAASDTKAGQATQKPENKQANDEAEFYLYQREQELTKILPDYESVKADLTKTLTEKYNVESPEDVFIAFSDIAKQNGTDIAKALFVMKKIPSILDELNKASNPFVIAKILEKAAGKVKTRTPKNIDTQPEPEITNTGVVTGGTDKLRQAWVKNPTKENYTAYMNSKKKVN